ncbi:uncharacterized protein K452DRAFT_288143 [Aplosporella prunicola CBS 121167]|uniref:Uncharacterized protein n=1 Tax=Aplosporella prunicola CBS 121167 TaxID=1176127 RepID=A0A6A6BDJ2_9PEZI|nr:uncharacterized protein K452DRAFT_288143 [Aplosporella prunicola CBS 121167]KAF2141443.1 hypothetical protein K452DRAFT_288143 [Aplosporella prunicola CBS 121167]
MGGAGPEAFSVGPGLGRSPPPKRSDSAHPVTPSAAAGASSHTPCPSRIASVTA